MVSGRFRLICLTNISLFELTRGMLSNISDFCLSISMFDDLEYCIRIEIYLKNFMLYLLIISKGSKIHGLYVLDSSIVISNILLGSQDFNNKNNI